MQMRNLAFRGLRLPRLGAMMQSGGGAVPFSIADLFASSEQGAWYGPSDLSTLFQDSAGTTPVTLRGNLLVGCWISQATATTPRKPRLQGVRHTRLALPAPQLTRLMIACPLQYQRAGDHQP